jgi:hypothetical protein
MLEMVQARQTIKVKEERHDLFSNLLAAIDEDVEVKLSTSELIGQTYVPPSQKAMFILFDRQYVRLPISRPRDISPYSRFCLRDAGTLSGGTGEAISAY